MSPAERQALAAAAALGGDFPPALELPTLQQAGWGVRAVK